MCNEEVEYRNKVRVLGGDWIAYSDGQFDAYKVCWFDNIEKRIFCYCDKEYFDWIRAYTKQNDCLQKFYKDFMELYARCKGKTKIESETIGWIRELADSYVDFELINKTYLILYYGLIAENLKARTRLGCAIKCLAVNQLLWSELSTWTIANWSKGKSFSIIQREAEVYGIK